MRTRASGCKPDLRGENGGPDSDPAPPTANGDDNDAKGMMVVATATTDHVQATRLDAQGARGIRARCDGCLAHIRRLGEMVSTACRWLWGALRALEALDDEAERQEIEEAIEAERLYERSVQLAISDGRITPAERAQLQIRAVAMDRELVDLRALNDGEDQQLEEARKCAAYARQTLAPASQALNYAEEQASPCHGGCEMPWADVRMG